MRGLSVDGSTASFFGVTSGWSEAVARRLGAMTGWSDGNASLFEAVESPVFNDGSGAGALRLGRGCGGGATFLTPVVVFFAAVSYCNSR